MFDSIKKRKASSTNNGSLQPVGAKFVSVILKNRIELSNTVEININFLGSGHAASKHLGAGEKYGQYEHVYYNFSVENSVRRVVINFTFSGPTKFDVLKPNIKSITKEAQEVLSDLISNINLLKSVIVIINILGHSRGGIVANNIKKWISLCISKWNNVRLGNFSIADPYAGPFNIIIDEKMSNFDKYSPASNTADTLVPSNQIVVYTVSEKRFRTPAMSMTSNIIVVTDVTHDKTKYISEYMLKNISRYKSGGGIYILADPHNQLKKKLDDVKNNSNPKQPIANWLKDNIRKVDTQNIDDILQGRGDYKNFVYNKISSDGRRALFYKAIAIADKVKVKEFLTKNKHPSMCRKIQAM